MEVNTSHHNRALNLTNRLSAVLWLSIFAFGLLIVGMYFGGAFAAMNTTYAASGVKSAFHRISPGDSIEQIYTVLGPPLRLHVNPDKENDGVSRQYTDTNVTLEHVLELMEDVNTRISLIYSEPKTTMLHIHYYFYYVIVSQSVTERAAGPIEMD